MSFLRKILLIAIISVFAINAEEMQAAQTIFDLPDNTPGLMKDKRRRKICEQYKDCIHIIVPNSPAERKMFRKLSEEKDFGKAGEKEAIIIAIYEKGNIYFPADGTQPTTKEVVEYSCTNVKDDAVTDWYIRAFGGDIGLSLSRGSPAPAVDNAPKMGFNTTNAPAHIITVDTTVPNTPEDFAQQFWQTFRKIASNPIGRILLYRILIEIRRVNETKEGSLDSCVNIEGYSDELMKERNNSRQLIVKISSKFSLASAKLSKERTNWLPAVFNFDNSLDFFCYQSILCNQQYKIANSTGYEVISAVRIGRSRQPLVVPVFHELVHWFHNLRDLRRKKLERSTTFLTQGSLSGLYYKDVASENSAGKDISSFPWGLRYNQEEHRTICGIPSEVVTPPLYYHGDELCENLFIASLKYIGGESLYFRHGHSETGSPDFYFFEDCRVIEKELKSIKDYLNIIIGCDNMEIYNLKKNPIVITLLRYKRGLGGFCLPIDI